MWPSKPVRSSKPHGSDCVKKGWHVVSQCKRRDEAIPNPPPFKLSRSGLLNAQFRYAPAKQQSIMKRNCQESRLLMLPSEIRNRIYLLVLGEKLIHVRYQPHERKYFNPAGRHSRSSRPPRESSDDVEMHYGAGLHHIIVSKTEGITSG